MLNKNSEISTFNFAFNTFEINTVVRFSLVHLFVMLVYPILNRTAWAGLLLLCRSRFRKQTSFRDFLADRILEKSPGNNSLVNLWMIASKTTGTSLLGHRIMPAHFFSGKFFAKILRLDKYCRELSF